jgi:hypothetical protein
MVESIQSGQVAHCTPRVLYLPVSQRSHIFGWICRMCSPASQGHTPLGLSTAYSVHDGCSGKKRGSSPAKMAGTTQMPSLQSPPPRQRHWATEVLPALAVVDHGGQLSHNSALDW